MAGQTSRDNGKRGGRPKEHRTIEKEKAREYLIMRLSQELEPIVTALIEKAKGSDVAAIKELFDRAWGKAPQAIDMTTKGEAMQVIINVPRPFNE